jgi:hypothetical protein
MATQRWHRLRASLRFVRDHAVLAPALRISTLTAGHGDILWTPDNWLSKPICDAVRRELRVAESSNPSRWPNRTDGRVEGSVKAVVERRALRERPCGPRHAVKSAARRGPQFAGCGRNRGAVGEVSWGAASTAVQVETHSLSWAAGRGRCRK